MNLQRHKSSDKYECKVCGKIHQEFPALAFSSPYQYSILSDDDKKDIATLNEDFCTIHHKDQIDRFIRVVLRQKIKKSCEYLEYGLWVSLSEESYTDYLSHFGSNNHDVRYFGWLCSQIPEYKNTLSIKTNVWTQSGGNRPEIIIQDGEYEKYNFARDYFEGISEKEAMLRVHSMMKSL